MYRNHLPHKSLLVEFEAQRRMDPEQFVVDWRLILCPRSIALPEVYDLTWLSSCSRCSVSNLGCWYPNQQATQLFLFTWSMSLTYRNGTTVMALLLAECSLFLMTAAATSTKPCPLVFVRPSAITTR